MSAASSRGRCRGDNVSNEGESDDRATAVVESRKKDTGRIEPRAVTGTLNSARDLTSGIGNDGPSQGVRSAAMRRACRRAHEARTKRALAAKEEKGRQAQFASLENFIAEADRGVRRDRHVEEKDAALKKRRRARRERELARRGGARRRMGKRVSAQLRELRESKQAELKELRAKRAWLGMEIEQEKGARTAKESPWGEVGMNLPLRPYRRGLAPDDAAAPAMTFSAPVESTGHRLQLQRAARDWLQAELSSGDSGAPKHALLRRAERAVAGSDDLEGLMDADPQFKEEGWKERVEEAVLSSPFAQTMEAKWKSDHVAHCGRCQTAPEAQRVAGFHTDCYGLKAYLAFTRGWRITFPGAPPAKRVYKNYVSVEQFPQAVQAAFMKLVVAGAFCIRDDFDEKRVEASIELLATPPEMVNPSVAAVRYSDKCKAEKEGSQPKVRLATDMTGSGVNAAAGEGKFYYTAVDTLLRNVTPGCYFYSVDLADFYCQLYLARESRQWTGMEVPWLDEETRRGLGAESGEGFRCRQTEKKRSGLWARFRSMPFGYKTACLWSSQVSAAVCERAAREGITVASYIDDLCGVASTKHEAQRRLDRLLDIIANEFGLRVNASKTVLPAQEIEFLGIGFDSIRCECNVTDARRQAIVEEVRGVLDDKWASAARLRSCIGRLSWIAQILPGARARVAPLYAAYKGVEPTSAVTLSQQQRKDLEYFVLKLTSGWTGSKWFLHEARELNVRSDASDTVAFLIHRGRFVYYRFTAKEAQASSHARELVPAALAARYFGHEWGGAVVGFTFDNSGAAASTSSLSSRDEAAQTSLRVVGDAASDNHFTQVGLWQPRTSLIALDAGSKCVVSGARQRPTYVRFKRSELAVATARVGAGMWLKPIARCDVTGAILGWVAIEEGAEY